MWVEPPDVEPLNGQFKKSTFLLQDSNGVVVERVQLLAREARETLSKRLRRAVCTHTKNAVWAAWRPSLTCERA